MLNYNFTKTFELVAIRHATDKTILVCQNRITKTLKNFIIDKGQDFIKYCNDTAIDTKEFYNSLKKSYGLENELTTDQRSDLQILENIENDFKTPLHETKENIIIPDYQINRYNITDFTYYLLWFNDYYVKGFNDRYAETNIYKDSKYFNYKSYTKKEYLHHVYSIYKGIKKRYFKIEYYKNDILKNIDKIIAKRLYKEALSI